MPEEWTEAPRSVINIAENLIRDHHLHLNEVSIGFIFRKKATKSNTGKTNWGTAALVSPQHKVYLDYDFLIWIAEDVYEKVQTEVREAMIDHLLSHCDVDLDHRLSIRKHDLEEFIDVIARHGLWDMSLRQAGKAMVSNPDANRQLILFGNAELDNMVKKMGVSRVNPQSMTIESFNEAVQP